MSSVNIDFALPTLHPKQEYIIQNAKRFNHLRCGRRFGKTTLIEELSSIALDGWPVGIWFPTYKDLSEVWKDLKKLYAPIISRCNEQLKQIELITDGVIDFWSMEDPDSGQGRKYKRAIIDEAAKALKLYQAWENTIRPTLTDYMGDAYILSRPKGKNNGFFKIEEKHRPFANWAFFHFTSYDNCRDVGGHLERSEIDEARQQLDDITFQQEYLAEYVDANDKPYLYAFSEKSHVIPTYPVNDHLALTISFDFNKDPMTCLVSQSPDISTMVIFDELKIPDGSTPELCEAIIAKYPIFLGRIFVTGDATGQNRNAMVRGNTNNYTLIKKMLGIKEYQLLVRPQNLAHGNSRILCNSVIQNATFVITENCKETISDCSRAAVDENGDLIKTQQEGRHCFVGETMVETKQGPKQIKDIVTNEEVLTRKGYRRVVELFNNGQCEVSDITLYLYSGQKIQITCTPDHKIWTTQGWLSISQLTSTQRVGILPSGLIERFTNFTQRQNTSAEQIKSLFVFMLKSINSIKAKLSQVSRYITLIMTEATTESTILKKGKCTDTGRSISSSELKTIQNGSNPSMKRDAQPQPNGAGPRREINSEKIKSKKNYQSLSRFFTPETLQNHVSIAESSMLPPEYAKQDRDSVLTIAKARGGKSQELMTSTEIALSAKTYSEQINIQRISHVHVVARPNKHIVYDLHVEDQHEYYANGVLVHNCFDNVRYLIHCKFPDFIQRPEKYNRNAQG